jgi:hypothetical protein
MLDTDGAAGGGRVGGHDVLFGLEIKKKIEGRLEMGEEVENAKMRKSRMCEMKLREMPLKDRMEG